MAATSKFVAKKLNGTKRAYVIGNNDYYQFGLGHKEKVTELTNWSKVNPDISVDSVKISMAGLIVKDKNKKHWSMGLNQHGQCAIREKEKDKNKKYVMKPSEIEFFRRKNIGIKEIFTSPNGWCMFWLTNNNEIYGNGYNQSHQLGTGDTEHHFEPIRVDLKDITQITIAEYYSIAVDAKGRVFATTHSVYGGNVLNVQKCKKDGNYGWERILEGYEIADIANGDTHSLFLSTEGIVYAVGNADQERLGNGESGVNRTPSPIPYFELNKIWILKIVCGRAHNLALDSNGKVLSWGSNIRGQCGDRISSIRTPHFIGPLHTYTIADIKCGTDHSYARTEEDQHYLFGSNKYYECSLKDVGAESVTIPYVINPIINEITKGEIAEVELGKENTVIVVVVDPKLIGEEIETESKKSRTQSVDKDEDNTSDKISELCEMLSKNEVTISKLRKVASSKDEELMRKDAEIDQLNEKLRVCETIASDQRKETDKLAIQMKRLKESKETEQKTDVGAQNEEQKSADLGQILKEWKLQKYIGVLIKENGYDAIEDWKDLTVDELVGDMGFKRGHAKRFKSKVTHFNENQWGKKD